MACSITGLVYLLGHQFHFQESILGAHNILAAHGVFAMLATLAFGSVLPFHIKAGLKSKNQLWSGFSQLGLFATLLISGASLYYGPEEIRDGAINAHWIVGLLFLVIFIWHGFIRLHSKV